MNPQGNFWSARIESEAIKKILNSHKCSLEKLLVDEDFILELKYSSPKLIKFL